MQRISHQLTANSLQLLYGILKVNSRKMGAGVEMRSGGNTVQHENCYKHIRVVNQTRRRESDLNLLMAWASSSSSDKPKEVERENISNRRLLGLQPDKRSNQHTGYKGRVDLNRDPILREGDKMGASQDIFKPAKEKLYLPSVTKDKGYNLSR